MTLELQDMVTAHRRPGAGQDDISVDLRVASIEHRIAGAGRHWQVDIGLLEADTDQPAIWDVSKWDEAVYGY